jgi:hypothetical protein
LFYQTGGGAARIRKSVFVHRSCNEQPWEPI